MSAPWPGNRPRPPCSSTFPGSSPPTTPSVPIPACPPQRVEFGTSGHRGSAFDTRLQRGATSWPSRRRSASTAAGKGYQRPAVPGHGHARALRAGLRQRARSAGRQRRRGHDRPRRRLHADAGHLARHPRRTTAAARTAWPTASSSRRRTIRPRTAASSTTRRTAVRPTPTSPSGSRSSANDLLAEDLRGVSAHALCAGAQRLHHAPPRLHRAYVDDLARGGRHGGDSRRRPEDRRRSAGRRRRGATGRPSPSATASTSRW